MAEAARSYCILEVDRETGERNQRDDRLSELLVRLTGAEAAIGVNNNAGAVLLLFQTFAGGKEAIVSRGELVEIGGSFRVPDVMARAGAALVEVGTTNRTRLSDYERAISDRTGLLVKVHTSNFRVVGFTEEVSPKEIADLGRKRNLTRTRPRVGIARDPEGSARRRAPRRRAARPRGRRERRRRRRVLRRQTARRAPSRPDRRETRGDRGLAQEPDLPRAPARQGRARGSRRRSRCCSKGGEASCPSARCSRRPPNRCARGPRDSRSGFASIADLEVAVVPAGSEPGGGSAPGIEIPTFVLRITHARRSRRSSRRGSARATAGLCACRATRCSSIRGRSCPATRTISCGRSRRRRVLTVIRNQVPYTAPDSFRAERIRDVGGELGQRAPHDTRTPARAPGIVPDLELRSIVRHPDEPRRMHRLGSSLQLRSPHELLRTNSMAARASHRPKDERASRRRDGQEPEWLLIDAPMMWQRRPDTVADEALRDPPRLLARRRLAADRGRMDAVPYSLPREGNQRRD